MAQLPSFRQQVGLSTILWTMKRRSSNKKLNLCMSKLFLLYLSSQTSPWRSTPSLNPPQRLRTPIHFSPSFLERSWFPGTMRLLLCPMGNCCPADLGRANSRSPRDSTARLVPREIGGSLLVARPSRLRDRPPNYGEVGITVPTGFARYYYSLGLGT